MSEEEAENKTRSEQSMLVALFADKLEVDEEVANILVEEGFASLDEVAYVPAEEFLKIAEFDEEIVEELRSRARNALLALAITGEGGKPAQDLLEMRGMNNALAQLLASKGICTMEDLAEQATDELLDIDGIEDEEQAAKLIMIAREPWFAEAKAESEENSDDKASNV